jgi:pyruvate/2-oxoglutarate dehydrogenase complex dihydrolipoamide acyltransferase (E2) component
MIKEEQLAAYKEMAKNASANGMEAQIRENLERTCDKFAGNEDKFERCISYLEDCASQILDGKSGDVPDEVCFRICRDYFNDEIWKVEDEEAAQAKAEAEERARRAEEEKKAKKKANKKAKKSKPRKAKPEEEKASKCARCRTEVLELEKGLCPACHALLHPAQEPEEEKPASEPEAESIPEQKPAFKPVKGQISFLDILGA